MLRKHELYKTRYETQDTRTTDQLEKKLAELANNAIAAFKKNKG